MDHFILLPQEDLLVYSSVGQLVSQLRNRFLMTKKMFTVYRSLAGTQISISWRNPFYSIYFKQQKFVFAFCIISQHGYSKISWKSFLNEDKDCLIPHCQYHGCWWYWFNSLWPSDAICWHRTGSTLAQVMACCLTAPSHYLNHCWLIIRAISPGILWRFVLDLSLKIKSFTTTTTSLRGQWVNYPGRVNINNLLFRGCHSF